MTLRTRLWALLDSPPVGEEIAPWTLRTPFALLPTAGVKPFARTLRGPRASGTSASGISASGGAASGTEASGISASGTAASSKTPASTTGSPGSAQPPNRAAAASPNTSKRPLRRNACVFGNPGPPAQNPAPMGGCTQVDKCPRCRRCDEREYESAESIRARGHTAA